MVEARVQVRDIGKDFGPAFAVVAEHDEFVSILNAFLVIHDAYRQESERWHALVLTSTSPPPDYVEYCRARDMYIDALKDAMRRASVSL